MGLFKTTPEEKAEIEKKRAEEAREQAEREFNASPPGQARAARRAGVTIFQIDIPLSKTKGYTLPMLGAFASSSKTTDCSNLIQSIEEEGWCLDNVGYVYRVTGSESRDKFLASGQQEAISGEIIGIYLFRVKPAASE